MVKIGDVYYEAEVRGVGEAQEQGSSLSDSFDDVAGSFLGTAAAEQEATDATKENTEAKRENERWTERLDSDTGLLSSSMAFLTSNFGIAATASAAYGTAAGYAAGATTLLNSAITTTYALLAGPAGLAAGLVLATIGVGLLGAELLGLTDVTPVVEAETDSMTGAFADMAFLIGGPLVGFLGAAFLALTGDFEGAKNMFINTAAEWAKAAARFAARVKLGFAAFGQAVVTGFRATVETMDFAWRAGLNKLIGFTNTWTEKIRDSIVGGLNTTIQDAVEHFNTLIEKANKLPKVDIEPISEDLQLGQTRGRQVGRIGTIQNEGLRSRLRRVGEQGRENLASVEEETRRQLEQFAPDTIGPGRRTRTGTGGYATLGGRRGGLPRQTQRRGGGAGARRPSMDRGGPQEQEINVEIGDQTLDLSQFNRKDLKKLAGLIGDELGTETNNVTGGR